MMSYLQKKENLLTIHRYSSILILYIDEHLYEMGIFLTTWLFAVQQCDCLIFY